MTLKESRERADFLHRRKERHGEKILENDERAIVILDDRVTELEAQRDGLRKTLRMLLDILENIDIKKLRKILAKYDKNLPGFKDIIGLYDEKTVEEKP